MTLREQEQREHQEETQTWQTKFEKSKQDLAAMHEKHAVQMRTAEAAQTMLFGEMKDRQSRYEEQVVATPKRVKQEQLAQMKAAQSREKDLQRLLSQINHDKAMFSERFRLATSQRDATATKLEEVTKTLHRSQLMNQLL